jgi:hypothetical protein
MLAERLDSDDWPVTGTGKVVTNTERYPSRGRDLVWAAAFQVVSLWRAFSSRVREMFRA